MDDDRMLWHLLENQERSVAKEPNPGSDKLIERVKQRLGNTLPLIFLSYPASAQLHANLLKGRLEAGYKISEVLNPFGKDILDEVINSIEICDYFIGIWHYEERLKIAEGKYGVSPWLPFEYGVAEAFKKPTIIIHSALVDESIWKRIKPGTHRDEYRDVLFIDMIDKIVRYCLDNFHYY